MAERPRRVRPVPPEVAARAGQPPPAVSEPELLDRLAEALAGLPREERAAAVVAFGLDEGTPGVAAQLDLPDEEAEALTRNAVQLLRGALAGLDPDDGGTRYPRLRSQSPPRTRTADDA